MIKNTHIFKIFFSINEYNKRIISLYSNFDSINVIYIYKLIDYLKYVIHNEEYETDIHTFYKNDKKKRIRNNLNKSQNVTQKKKLNVKNRKNVRIFNI